MGGQKAKKNVGLKVMIVLFLSENADNYGWPLWEIRPILVLALNNHLKDVLMGTPKSDLLGVTMAVIHVAGQRFLAV